VSDDVERTTIALRVPIEFGKGQVIEELSFRAGQLGDLRGLKLGENIAIDDIIIVASRMCGTAAAALHKLEAEDAGEVMTLALGFIAQCLPAGEMPSPS
jgi:hypothetical protein